MLHKLPTFSLLNSLTFFLFFLTRKFQNAQLHSQSLLQKTFKGLQSCHIKHIPLFSLDNTDITVSFLTDGHILFLFMNMLYITDVQIKSIKFQP